MVTIKLPSEFKNEYTITISDAIGKEILRYENVNQNLFKVDMTNIEKGLYIINVKTKDINVLSEKIILIE